MTEILSQWKKKISKFKIKCQYRVRIITKF